MQQGISVPWLGLEPGREPLDHQGAPQPHSRTLWPDPSSLTPTLSPHCFVRKASHFIPQQLLGPTYFCDFPLIFFFFGGFLWCLLWATLPIISDYSYASFVTLLGCHLRQKPPLITHLPDDWYSYTPCHHSHLLSETPLCPSSCVCVPLGWEMWHPFESFPSLPLHCDLLLFLKRARCLWVGSGEVLVRRHWIHAYVCLSHCFAPETITTLLISCKSLKKKVQRVMSPIWGGEE